MFKCIWQWKTPREGHAESCDLWLIQAFTAWSCNFGMLVISGFRHSTYFEALQTINVWHWSSPVGARSVAVSYKPPMLVTRVRLPACAGLPKFKIHTNKGFCHYYNQSDNFNVIGERLMGLWSPTGGWPPLICSGVFPFYVNNRVMALYLEYPRTN